MPGCRKIKNQAGFIMLQIPDLLLIQILNLKNK